MLYCLALYSTIMKLPGQVNALDLIGTTSGLHFWRSHADCALDIVWNRMCLCFAMRHAMVLHSSCFQPSAAHLRPACLPAPEQAQRRAGEAHVLPAEAKATERQVNEGGVQ